MSTRTSQDIRTWTFDPVHSQVEFGVRHMMLSTVKGYFTGIGGSLRLDEEDLSRSSVDVTIDVATIDTRNEDRDAHLRSADFFAAEEHPEIRFESREIVPADEGFEIVGDLRIRDVTRPITLRAEELGRGQDPWGNPRVGFRAEGELDRKDYGLTWNQALETGGVLVGDEVRIAIEVQAIPAEEDG